jgi:hypothetical protein
LIVDGADAGVGVVDDTIDTRLVSPETSAHAAFASTCRMHSTSDANIGRCVTPRRPSCPQNLTHTRSYAAIAPVGARVEETVEDPSLTNVTREHARATTDIVEEGCRQDAGHHGSRRRTRTDD